MAGSVIYNILSPPASKTGTKIIQNDQTLWMVILRYPILPLYIPPYFVWVPAKLVGY